MAAELLSFFRPAVGVRGDWSAQEIAEFYRVEAALVQAGVSVLVDRGISDEGDPWFVFCRVADHEVIVHFARIAGKYIIATEAMGQTFTGMDFRRLLTEFVSRNPTLLPLSSAGGAKLLLHPASLLAAVVATALYYMSGTEAVAHNIDATTTHHNADDIVDKSHSGPSADFDRKSQDQQLAAAVVAMIALATLDYFQSSSDSHGGIIQQIADVSLDRSEGSHLVITDDQHSVDAVTSHVAHLLAPVGHTAWHEGHIGSGSITSVIEPTVPEKTANDSDLSPEKTLAASQSPQGHLHSNGLPDTGMQDQNTGTLDSGGTGLGLGKIGIPFVGHQLDLKADISHLDGQGVGSSSLDTAVSGGFDAQTALASMNNGSGFLQQPLAQINLAGNLSIEEVIIHTANDLFGNSSLSVMTNLFDAKNSIHPVVATSLPDTGSTENFQAGSSTTSISNPPNQDTLIHYPLFNDEANAIISSFVKLNSFEVITSDRNIVLFDMTASDFASPDLTVKTWSMHDGSTISIVGVLPHQVYV